MFLGGTMLKNPPAKAGDAGDVSLILGRSPRGGNGNPHQYSCLENSTDGGAWKELETTEHTCAQQHRNLRVSLLVIRKHITVLFCKINTPN